MLVEGMRAARHSGMVFTPLGKSWRVTMTDKVMWRKVKSDAAPETARLTDLIIFMLLKNNYFFWPLLFQEILVMCRVFKTDYCTEIWDIKKFYNSSKSLSFRNASSCVCLRPISTLTFTFFAWASFFLYNLFHHLLWKFLKFLGAYLSSDTLQLWTHIL